MSQDNQANFAYLLTITLVTALGGILFGFDTGVVSGLTESVKAQFSLSEMMQGWFTSSIIIGCMIGAGISGFSSDAFGRKGVMIAAAVMFFVSAWGCGFAYGFYDLFAYRFLGGIGVGIASMVAPLYISEISPSHLRGRLVAVFQLAIVSGLFLSYLSNAMVRVAPEFIPSLFTGKTMGFLFVQENWRGMFLVECLPAAVYFFALFFVPESPRWWVAKGREDKANGILTKLFGQNAAENEIRNIKDVIGQNAGSFSELFSKKLLKGLRIAVVLMFLSQVTGINAVMYYGVSVFKGAGFAEETAFWLQVLIGVTNIVFTFVAIGLVDHWGRKPLLKIGTTAIFIALTLVSLIVWTKSPESTSVLPMMLILLLNMIFIAAFAMSWGAIPWVIVAEIFPTRIRGRASSVGTFTIWFSCFLVVQMFPIMNAKIGIGGCYAIFAAFMFMALIFVWFYLPETKGRSLEQIESELYGK